MRLERIKTKEHNEASQILTDYWRSRGMSYSKAWTKKYLKEGHKTEIRQDIIFAIKEKRKLCGIISAIVLEGNVAELRDFVIKKEFQGKGYGTKAVNQVLTWCKKRKIRKVVALCCPATKRITQKLGFIKEGLLKDHFVKGESLTIMSKFP
ncbi:MAG: GNAT family N-acetyltransferase [Candidatus Woesearchaeota archaeon]